MGNYTISQIFENRRRGRQARNFTNKCSENSRSQIFFRTHIFRKLTLGAPTNFRTDKSLHASGAFRFHGTRRTVQVLVWTLVNSTAISNRICTVPCKRVAQVKNSSVQKFVPDPCKRYVSFRSIFNRVFTTRRRRQRKCHLKSEFALFQSLSRLFQLADVVKCRPILPWVDFLGITSESKKTGRKFCRRWITSFVKREIRHFHAVVVR